MVANSFTERPYLGFSTDSILLKEYKEMLLFQECLLLFITKKQLHTSFLRN